MGPVRTPFLRSREFRLAVISGLGGLMTLAGGLPAHRIPPASGTPVAIDWTLWDESDRDPGESSTRYYDIKTFALIGPEMWEWESDFMRAVRSLAWKRDRALERLVEEWYR
jgi:hypothetical protein